MKVKTKKKLAICICTFRRPELLTDLLSSIFESEKSDVFELSIVIVDNDEFESAKHVIDKFMNRGVDIRYNVELSRNISNVRNRCVDVARNFDTDYILFLDDDEFISKNYFLGLALLYVKDNPDVIIGPVVTCYYPETPRWIIQTRIFERSRRKTGTIQSTGNTGNAFISLKLIDRVGGFNLAYGTSGGEDSEFFYRCKSIGTKFVWCDESEAFEYLAMDRANLKYAVKRARRGGQTYAKIRCSEYSSLQKVSIAITRSVYGGLGAIFAILLILFSAKRVGPALLIRSIARLGQIEGLFGKAINMYGK
jgi:succinoglycan biosynthesis protein ExoM